jgi:hypothetical protein
VDCLEVKLKQANEEIVMLNKVCASKKQRWVDLNEDEVLRLWHICKIPVHLEKPNDIGHRFAGALSFGLREANYYAFCIDAKEGSELARSKDKAPRFGTYWNKEGWSIF